MKKTKLYLLALIIVFSINTPILSAYAAPQTMSDGTVFDPQYYAENNPDVVNVYGNTAKRLYQHYVEYGKSEGRKPTADSKDALTKLKEQYPNGTVWDNKSVYELPNVPIGNGFYRKNTGFRRYGSEGWAWLVHDTLNELNEDKIWKYHFIVSTDVNTVKPHDVVWLKDTVFLNNPGKGIISHVVFVMDVNYENRTFTASEGNYNGTVNWNVTYSFDDILETQYMEKDKKGQEQLYWIRDGVETY